MTVPEQIPFTEQVANGVTVKFFVQFQYANKNDLHIFVDGVEPSISEVYFDDNAFNFYSAPQAGKVIKIQRITPKERDTDYDQSDNTFRPRVVNADFDKIWCVLQEVFADIGGLSQAVQDEVIARIQGDDDLLNQLSAEISARILGDEAVTNDLKDYVNQVVGAILNDPAFDGIDASKVNTDSGETQQQVNDRGGATWYSKSGGYGLNDRVILNNGDEVISTESNNTANPNFDMTGWVNPSKDQKDLNDKLTSINQLRISPKWFGSPNNGVDDDAQGIRAAIAFIKLNGGGILDLQSTTEWKLKTKHATEDANIVVDFANIIFDGGTQKTIVRTEILDVDAQVLFKNGSQFASFQNVHWHGNSKVNYNVKTADGVFVPCLHTHNSTFFVAKLAGMRVNTYVSNFTLTRWGFSVDGLQINPNTDVATSLTFNSSYAQNCTGSGFKTIGNVIYSVFNGCAVDDCDISYDLSNCNVVVLSGCGTEKSRKALKIKSSASVIANGFLMLGCGSLDSANPTDALIDVEDGRLILDGMRNLTMEGRTTYYTKEAKTQGWGFIDARRSMSLSRKNVSKGTHPDFDSTILCWDDKTHVDQTVTLAPNALAAWITDNLRGRVINHKITIQLTGGVESSGSDNKVLQYMKGYGSVIIQGNASNRSDVVILGAHTKLQALDNTCNIIFKNLTIINSDSNDRAFHQLYARDSKLIILDNVNISATGQIGAAVYAGGDTTVKFINNAEATQTLNGNYQATITVIAENGAEVIYEPRATAPSTGYYGRSTFIPAKQNASEILGWYCDGSGSTVSGWKTSKVYTGV